MIWTVFGWWIAVFLPWAFFLVFSLVQGRRAYKNEERGAYSFLIHFPYELFSGHTPARHSARITFYVFCGLDAFACALPLVFLDFHPGLLSIAVTLFVVGVLKNVSLAVMASVPAYEFKPHLISFTAFGGFAVLEAVISILFFINRFSVNQGVALTFALVLGAVGLALAALLVNPRLSRWTKLNAVVDEDGTITTSRPRPFPLAFTQWLLILLSGLTTLTASLGLLTILLMMI